MCPNYIWPISHIRKKNVLIDAKIEVTLYLGDKLDFIEEKC